MSTKEKIVYLYLTLSGMFTLAASLIWGVNTLFLLDAGLNLFETFVVNSIFTASMALFEIPTGIFADTLGRRMSFLFGTLTMALSTFLYVWVADFDNSFLYLSLVSIFLGFAFTFYSGATEAWLVDALTSVDASNLMDYVFARNGFVTSIATLIGTLGGGLLAFIDLKIPYILRGIILLALFVIAFIFMKDLGFEVRPLKFKDIPKEMTAVAKDSLRYGLRQKSIRQIMFISFVFSAYMMWAWYAWQPHFLELFGNPSAVWIVGPISAAISLAMGLGSKSLGFVLNLFRKRSTLMLWAYSLMTICLLVVGFASNFYISVGGMVTFAYLLGLMGPVKQVFLHKMIPSDKRATVISFDSLIGSSGSVIGQNALGFVSNNFGIPFGYGISGLVNLCVLPFIGKLGKINDDANQINSEELDYLD